MDFEGPIKMTEESARKMRIALKKWQRRVVKRVEQMRKNGMLDVEDTM
jgi:hypothetical protein